MTAIETARQLYLEHSGRSHRLIEREMRGLGFTTFSRRRFYSHRTRSGKLRLGWIEKFRWKEGLAAPKDAFSVNPCSTVAKNSSSQRLCASVVKNSSNPQSAIPDPQFKSWLPIISPTMRWDLRYQELIYKKLNEITDGSSKRLMIFLPPRHGKSELVTVRYSAWRLKNDPSLNIILGSYSQRLANRFSRKVRVTWEDAIATQAHASSHATAAVAAEHSSIPKSEIQNPKSVDSRTFAGKTDAFGSSSEPVAAGTGSNPKSKIENPKFSSRRRLNTVAEWETGLGGGLRAVGVGGGITGFGAGLVIIDDPVKSRAEAESKTYREKLWEWYRDDLYTRLEPNASIILIQTRWHEDDLAGRLLKEMQDGGEHWDVIELPALAEADPRSEICDPRSLDALGRAPGEPLCPDRFTREDLLRIKRSLGSYSFSALYQQRPVPAEGGLFKRSWFSRIVDRAPDSIRWCRGYDLALSVKDSADFTASFRCGIDVATGDLYIADGFRKRIEFPDQRRYILARMLEEKGTEHGIEQALHGLAFIQEFRREHRLVSRAFRSVKVSADKFTRALSWANRAEEGKVVFVRGHWIDEFLEEITSFPSGAHDDQIDAVSIAVEMLEHRRHTACSF